MPAFLAGRLIQSVLIMLGMSFVVYALIGLMPGDPIDILIAANPEATAEDAARLRAIYGLDQPLLSRYGHWLSRALHGDFGYSRLFSQPVTDLIGPRLIQTLILMFSALTLAVLIALPAGMYAAYRKNTLSDRVINFLCFAGISLPSFWLALLFISFFAVTLMWLPAGGFALEGADLWTEIQFLALPVIVLALATVAGYTRYLRAAMIETLEGDYIRTARAKGCSERRVVLNHALRPRWSQSCRWILAVYLAAH